MDKFPARMSARGPRCSFAAALAYSRAKLSNPPRGQYPLKRIGVPVIRGRVRADGRIRGVSVWATDLLERLLHSIGPKFDEIGADVEAVSDQPEKPRGNFRITTGEHAARVILCPALTKLLPRYPDIKVEVVVDYGLTDIVAERNDAGIRLGEQVAKDMIAVRIGPDMCMAVAGAPSYFAKRGIPKKPQDLTEHECIKVRLPTYGGIYAWEFEKSRRELKVRVEGQLTVNGMLNERLQAALDGFGLVYMPEDVAQPYVADGRLVSVLKDWSAPFSGYHLY